MAAGLVLVVIPFVWMVLSSFKPEAEVRAVPADLVAGDATTENYDQLFTKLDFPTYFINSAIVAVATAVGQHGLLLDARLRPGEAGLPGQEGASSRWCSAR